MIFLANENVPLKSIHMLMGISNIILEGKFTVVERERIRQRPLS